MAIFRTSVFMRLVRHPDGAAPGARSGRFHDADSLIGIVAYGEFVYNVFTIGNSPSLCSIPEAQ
jgi:hypothetical protein